MVKLNGASNRIVHFIKNFVISITNIENRLQPLLEEAISTHTMNELKKRVDAAWQELQKMKQDSESMDSTVTQFKQIHENAKQINLDQLNAVVTSLRAQDQEQARNAELVVARIDKEIDMLTSDHVSCTSALTHSVFSWKSNYTCVTCVFSGLYDPTSKRGASHRN